MKKNILLTIIGLLCLQANLTCTMEQSKELPATSPAAAMILNTGKPVEPKMIRTQSLSGKTLEYQRFVQSTTKVKYLNKPYQPEDQEGLVNYPTEKNCLYFIDIEPSETDEKKAENT